MNEWKLFVGQVPLEATEQDLQSLFGPIGDIVELYILRNNNGKSRGCAFVTYSNKGLAQQAITQLNGKQVPPGKTLVVKFADRAQAGKAAAAQGAISAPLLSPSTSPGLGGMINIKPPVAGPSPPLPDNTISLSAAPTVPFFS